MTKRTTHDSDRPAGRKRASSSFSKAFRRRMLRWQAIRSYRSQAKLAESAGVEPSTLKGWLTGSDAKRKTPDLASLLQLAEKEPVSLDWLLLGEGSEQRGVSRPIGALEVDLRATVVNALGRTARDRREVEVLLPRGEDLLLLVQDWARKHVNAERERRRGAINANKKRLLQAQAKDLASVSAQLPKAIRRKIDVLHQAARSLDSVPEYTVDPWELPAQPVADFELTTNVLGRD